ASAGDCISPRLPVVHSRSCVSTCAPIEADSTFAATWPPSPRRDRDTNVEPTARSYTIAGDLWDYLYDRAVERGRRLLPLTLEMGSWAWVRKNPIQALTALGRFNPIKPHRL